MKHNRAKKKQHIIPLVTSSRCPPLCCSHSASRSWTLLIALCNTSTGILETSSCIHSVNPSVKYAWHCFLTVLVLGKTHSRPAKTLFEWCSHSVNVLWGANCFNTTTFLRPSGARQVLLYSNEFGELSRENRIALSCLVIVLCFFMLSHVWRVWRFSWDKKMSVFHEQRICVKFCVKIGKSVTETF